MTVKSLRETLIHDRNPINRSDDADDGKRKEGLLSKHQPAIASGFNELLDRMIKRK